MSTDHFAAVEHVEFNAHAQGADDVQMFFDLTRQRPQVQALQAQRDPPAILARMRTLLHRPTDLKYQHPHDVACAVYLDLLFRLDMPDLVQEAWELCHPHRERLYWTNLVAKSINVRVEGMAAVQAATTGAIPTDTPASVASLPPPPPRVNTQAFAAAFYDLYNAVQRELAPPNQPPPVRPAWKDLPTDHYVRRLMQTTCDRVLDRLEAIPVLGSGATSDKMREAVVALIQGGQIEARVVLRMEA